MSEAVYIHGTRAEEQERLTLLNRLTNAPFLAFLELADGEAVLEVGSGLGILAAEAAHRIHQGSVTGIEYAQGQLDAVTVSAPNLHFRQGDAHALPFEDDTFDLVYCRYLLEHLHDPARAVGEMRRVLKPGGRLCVQENDDWMSRFDPDCPVFYEVWLRFVELQSRLGGDGHIGRKLFGLLKRAGFREIKLSLQPEIHWAGEPGFRPWVENIIGNVQGAAERLMSEGLASRSQIETAVGELRALMDRDDASALFHWNRARGVK